MTHHYAIFRPGDPPPWSVAASDAKQSRQPIIYDLDDRRDVYDNAEPALGALVESSVVALVPQSTLVIADDGTVELRAQSLEAAYQLCPGARFADQPTAAACSAVLIDRDLVLTAAHCLEQGFGEELRCDQHAYVLDYFFRAADRLETVIVTRATRAHRRCCSRSKVRTACRPRHRGRAAAHTRSIS